jgi:hypothetical protein
VPAPSTLRLRRGLNLRRLGCAFRVKGASVVWGLLVGAFCDAGAPWSEVCSLRWRPGGLLFPTAATAGADVPVGPGAHAVRSARADGVTVVDLTE